MKIAEIRIARAPDTLVTVVGSCIGLCLWDKTNKTGGLVHLMLPESNGNALGEAGKYVDTGVSALLEKMEKTGCERKNLIAKIYGGASMFFNAAKTSAINVGEKNRIQVKKHLELFRIRITEEETGGTAGRKILFCVSDGKVDVRTLK